MKFGICTGAEKAPIVAQLGYDYIELTVVGALKPQESDSAHVNSLNQLLIEAGLHAEAFNVLLPGDLRVTGPSVDPIAQKKYLETACQRAAALGGKILVFGSGGARNVPEGYDREKAWEEIRAFLSIAADAAADNGICLVIEPLNHKECNILNSVAEAVEMAKQVNRPEAVAVLSDLYHVTVDEQSFEETAEAAKLGLLRHVHVACTTERRVPREEDLDVLVRYFSAFKKYGYEGRISIEAGSKDFNTDAKIGLSIMRQAWENATA